VSAEKRVLLHPGEFFGEMSILDGGPRSATVVADTPLRLLVISRRHFSVLLKDVPGLTQTLLATLSKRVRQAEERAERLGSASTGL
jgi:CRP-like cAMP-binding protein